MELKIVFFCILTLLSLQKGDVKMKVKVFDESHEKDLERVINAFLSTTNSDIIDVKYNVAIAVCGEEQIYCFSALIVYSSKE